MAQEIYHSAEKGGTYYALIFRIPDDKVWVDDEDAIDGGDFTSYAGASIANYAVTLTQISSNQYYTIKFPSLITTPGVYRVQIFLQDGGSPDDDDDIVVSQGEIYWDGVFEINLQTVINAQSRVLNIYNK